MEFGWSEEQRQLYDDARAFAAESLNGFEDSATRQPAFGRANWEACAAFGVQGLFVPEEYGGRGMDILSTILALQGIGYGCRDNGFTLALNGHMWAVTEPLLGFGTEEQKRHFLPRLCNGEWIGAHGMSEPESGSDAFSLTTSAVRTDGGYLLNGHKVFIGLAPVCDLALIFARTDPDKGRWGISAFLVETDGSGITLSEPVQAMGLSGTVIGEIVLEDCFVPESSRLGAEGAGVTIFNDSMEWERSFIFSSHVGAMERQLDETVAYARERRQFGQRIGDFQSVSNRVADMKLRLEMAKLLLYRCAWAKQHKERIMVDAALSKLHISESFVQSSLDAVRVRGARGYMQGSTTERDLRDATGGVLYSGTSDIQRQLIARLLGL